MGVKRITRLLRLLVRLQSESQCSPEELLENMEVSRRTLYRDLRALQEAGIPCYYDRTGNSYRVDHGFYMPPPGLTAKEAFSLFLLVRKARESLEIPFSAAAQRAALKIGNTLSPDIRRQCREKLKNISIHAGRRKPKVVIEKRFEVIQRAIHRRLILNITYRCRREEKLITADFSPLHLIYTNAWYVMGKINLSRQIQSIKLENIEKIEKTDKCFFDEEEFKPSDHLGRAWATVPEGRLYNIVLKFAPEVAHEITSVKWHDTQYATIEQDGSAVLEFRVDGLNEIVWWILGFGDKVEVLRPEVLRERIHKIAANMAIKSETASKKLAIKNIAASQNNTEHVVSLDKGQDGF